MDETSDNNNKQTKREIFMLQMKMAFLEYDFDSLYIWHANIASILRTLRMVSILMNFTLIDGRCSFRN